MPALGTGALSLRSRGDDYGLVVAPPGSESGLDLFNHGLPTGPQGATPLQMQTPLQRTAPTTTSAGLYYPTRESVVGVPQRKTSADLYNSASPLFNNNGSSFLLSSFKHPQTSAPTTGAAELKPQQDFKYSRGTSQMNKVGGEGGAE